MQTNRISVDIASTDHKILKSYCATAGITIKDFVVESVLDNLETALEIKKIKKKGRRWDKLT